MLLVLGMFGAAAAGPGDVAQWGVRGSRNMVSDQKGLPLSCDPETGRNVLWTAPLGTQTYSTPIAAGGCVLIGTNNDVPRDSRHRGDRGVLLCLDQATGKLRWQLVVHKRTQSPYLDWPQTGIVSPVTVEGSRVYVVTNRDEVACLDLRGMANGNDGPYRDEALHCVPSGQPAVPAGPSDADILWITDLTETCDVHPHDAAHGSPLIVGPTVYVCSSNGVDDTHLGVPKPDAPGLIALDKATGRIVGSDIEHTGRLTIHCSWSSPAYTESAGKPQIVFCGGDGIVYGFDQPSRTGPSPVAMRARWRFDCDPTAPKVDIFKWQDNFQDGPSNINGMPVAVSGRVYVASGGDTWHGKKRSVLHCIDATRTGDVTATGAAWAYPMQGYCMATPSVTNSLIVIPTVRGQIHCVDASTGKGLWTHTCEGEVWGSTLVAEGRIYAATRRGELLALAHGRTPRLLASSRLDSAINGSPTAANGVLYVATMRTLYALKSGAKLRTSKRP